MWQFWMWEPCNQMSAGSHSSWNLEARSFLVLSGFSNEKPFLGLLTCRQIPQPVSASGHMAAFLYVSMLSFLRFGCLWVQIFFSRYLSFCIGVHLHDLLLNTFSEPLFPFQKVNKQIKTHLHWLSFSFCLEKSISKTPPPFFALTIFLSLLIRDSLNLKEAWHKCLI